MWCYKNMNHDDIDENGPVMTLNVLLLHCVDVNQFFKFLSQNVPYNLYLPPNTYEFDKSTPYMCIMYIYWTS